MSRSLLITTFTTWLPHQTSNASDDLVQQVSDRLPPKTYLLRHLPVHNQAATEQLTAAIHRYQPQQILCCGMAESRTLLELEKQATLDGHTRMTSITIEAWLEDLPHSNISYDAGNFVCNYLYYQALRLCATSDQAALFVHVPILTSSNQTAIATDFLTLINKLIDL